MTVQPYSIREDRPLRGEERELLRWLLSNADARGRSFLSRVDTAHVAARCDCGCASIEFRIDGIDPPPGGKLEQLSSDYYWVAPGGGLCGIFVYAKEDRLAGMEVWSVDGREIPAALPSIEQLRPDAFDAGSA